MKHITSFSINLVVVVAALALPAQMAAQQTRYKLIDVGTLGGPAAYGPGSGVGSEFLNNAGIFVGTADTSTPDPSAPNCLNSDCFLSHAFRWQKGVLTDLGTLPGGNFSNANSINARGWIAGGATTGEIDPLNSACVFQPLCPQFHGVLWKDGEIIDIGTLGEGLESNTMYVNNAGTVVGFSTIDTSPDPFSFLGASTHAFIWQNGVIRDLGTLGGPDSFAAGGCSNQRSDLVAGSSLINSTPNDSTGFPTQHAFLWENGTMTDIPTLGGTSAGAQCANNQGQVIGQSNLAGDAGCPDSCVQHAFSWDHGTLTDLGTLGGSSSVAIGLNNQGEAVGAALTTDDESFHATLWRNGLITDLGTLPGDCFSFAFGVNSKGQIVGQSYNCDFSLQRAVLWDKGSIIDLNAAIGETNINERGEIAGVGLPPGCDDFDLCGRAFLLIPCAGGQGCEGGRNFATQSSSPAIALQAKTTLDPQTTKQFVARWRARLMPRYHIPPLPTGKDR